MKQKIIAVTMALSLLTGLIVPIVQKTEAAETAISNKKWTEVQSVAASYIGTGYSAMGLCTGYVYTILKEGYGVDWGDNSPVDGLQEKLAANCTFIGSTSSTSAPAGAKPGDIIIFTENGSGTHCGIYGENGVMYHNSSSYGVETRDFAVWMSYPDSNKNCDTAHFYRGLAQNGYLKIQKNSAKPEITNGNNCYSLQGAQFRITGNGVDRTVTTDANGAVNNIELPAGTYTVTETKAPPGYALSASSKNITITSGATSTASFSNLPQNDPVSILLGKRDLESNRDIPTGDGELQNAHFKVEYYASNLGIADGKYGSKTAAGITGTPTRSWTFKTNENGFAYFSNDYLVSGDAFYTSSSGNVTFPLGTVVIYETKAPEGYLLNNDVFVRNVKTDGTGMEEVNTYNVPTEETAIKEQVKRGDIEFIKSDEETAHRLSGIPFHIESVTTGESHILVTDANGIASSAASHNSHKLRTNINDNIYDEATDTVDETKLDPAAGIWFFGNDTDMSAITDNKGALIYDTYVINELPVAKNQDKDLIENLYIVISRDNTTVDIGSITNHDITTTSNAQDKDLASKTTLAREDLTIQDTVVYDGAEPGKEYTMKGTIMDKETGDPVIIDGEKVTAEKTFTPTSSKGDVQVEFTFDAKSLTGKDVVVFERMMAGQVTASFHEDINDLDQTISFLSTEIDTTAINDATGTQEARRGDVIKITDTVTYSNLMKRGNYVIKGTLVDKATGDPVLVDGKEVTDTQEFFTNTGSGELEMHFTFDSSDYEGNGVVVTQSLTWDGHKVIEHNDLNDEDQTIYFPEIKTSAKDSKSGTKLSLAGSEATIIDTVTYKSLTAGNEYTLTATLMDKETGEPLKIDGKNVTATRTFTPDSRDGEVEVPITLNAKGLEGKTVVVYEVLEANGVRLAEHEDIGDAKQTVKFPKLGTNAVDSDTKLHMANADETVIIDTVSYENVLPGEEYTVSGVLMDKETGEPFEINGRKITATETFTAEKESGAVDISFAFDAKNLEGKTGVVFEELLLKGGVVGEHKNIDDEDQTVYFPKIKTTALDSETGLHLAYADEVTIIDTVSYENVIPGLEYTIKGEIYHSDSGEAVKDKGLLFSKPVTAEKTFTAEKSSGSQKLEFTFDASELAGKSVVVYETLMVNGKVVGSHKVIDDPEQTVHFPKIGTQVSEKNENNLTDVNVSPLGEVAIVDTVEYENLIPGSEYEIKGHLTDKETGEKLEAGGKTVTSKTTFTPEDTEGTVDVEFTFDSTGMEGKTLVASEFLHAKGKVIAAHDDIDDKSQTFMIRGIGTTVRDSETGLQHSRADNEVVVFDTVRYEHLEPGVEHTLKGVLMDKETGDPLLLEDEAEITGETTFTPEDPFGSVEVKFAFNGEALGGKEVVVFEELHTEEGLVEEHKDINAASQTLSFPTIKTKAFIGEPDVKTITSPKATVTDRVEYENLVPGKNYYLTGALIDKETERCIAVGEEFFTPEKPSGYADVEIKVNAQDYNGKELVVYETLWYTDKKVADHEDINDADQTVKVDIPEPPKTGTGFIFPVILLAALSGAGMLFYKKRRV